MSPETEPRNSARGTPLRLATTGLALLALALLAYGTLRVTFGSRPALVHVRWAPSVQPDDQRHLEQTYHLTARLQDDGRTFSYELTDLSRANIQALVTDPAVEDTHYIHRTAFRVGYLTPRSAYPGAGAKLGPLLETTILLLLLLGATAMAFCAIALAGPEAVRQRLPMGVFLEPGRAAIAARDAITERFPHATAEQAALFRIVFGIALVALFSTEHLGPESVASMTNAISGLHHRMISPFAAAPAAIAWVWPWLFFWGLLFIAGAATRLAFGMVILGALAWSALVTTRVGYHTMSALLLALFCLWGSRWSDVWSVDAWWRRRTGRPPATATPREYGYTLWIPGVVLGVAFAAAAVAKMKESGIAWILNGTVKYHFLTDAGQAMLDWGLRIGRHPELAVLLSLAAVITEALVIVGASSRVYRYRLLSGVAALALLVGFAVFQGLFWRGWWILLLSFLPWHLITPRSSSTAAVDSAAVGNGPSRLQPWLVVALVAQQAAVSGLWLEQGPVFSTYEMYATTYASPQEYERHMAPSYWLVAGDGRECKVEKTDADDAVRGQTEARPPASTSSLARRCFGQAPPGPLKVEERRTSIDWAQWQPNYAVRTLTSANIGR